MTDEPDSLILRMLRRMDEKLDRVIDDMNDVKGGLASLERSVAAFHIDMAGMSARIDRVESRLGRIERRLDLVEAP